MSKELKVWLNVNPHQDRLRAKQYSAAIFQNLLREYHPSRGVFDVLRAKNGKPYVENGPHFSYTHCGRLHAYVIDDEPIGIDLERINGKRNIQGIAQRHYHEAEWQQMQNLILAQQSPYFFKLWTQKEAWCKHQGGVLWYFLPQKVCESGLNYYHVNAIGDMACCLATTETVSRIDLNVVK